MAVSPRRTASIWSAPVPPPSTRKNAFTATANRPMVDRPLCSGVLKRWLPASPCQFFPANTSLPKCPDQLIVLRRSPLAKWGTNSKFRGASIRLPTAARVRDLLKRFIGDVAQRRQRRLHVATTGLIVAGPGSRSPDESPLFRRCPDMPGVRVGQLAPCNRPFGFAGYTDPGRDRWFAGDSGASLDGKSGDRQKICPGWWTPIG